MTVTITGIENLPPPEMIEELDYSAILAQYRDKAVALYPEIAPIIDLESEPARKIAEAGSYRETLLRARINDALRATLIAFATGADLDHLAAFYDAVRLPGEGDHAFRRRTILIIASRSTGGTEPRYRALALGASIRVRDAKPYKDKIYPTVYIAVIANDNNGVADEPLLEAVRLAVNGRAARMINDTIIVRSAVSQTVNIAADLWLYPDTAADVAPRIEQALRTAWTNESGLGFDLTQSWLIARLMQAGVQRVAITAPADDTRIPDYEAIALGTVSLTIKGRDF